MNARDVASKCRDVPAFTFERLPTRLHLEGRARLGEDGADPERPVLLEQDLARHVEAHSTMSGTCSAKDTSVWSPPRTTLCIAPA